jgi:hypothetical protein
MKTITLILFLFPILAISKTEKAGFIVKADDYKSLSFNKAQSVRKAYLTFFKRVEKVENYPAYKGEKFSSFPGFEKYWKNIEKYYSAYAADGDVCFFGGWPSKLKDNLCEGPWHHSDSKETIKLGGGYNRGSSCGAPEYFRCNPAIFGSPVPGVKAKENGVEINLSPKNGNSKGYCVNAKGSYIELSKKCELASDKSIEKQIEEIQDEGEAGKAKRKQLEDLHSSIFGKDGKTGFCGTYKSSKGEVYDACDDLKKRLNALGLPFIPAKKVPQKVNAASTDVLVEESPIFAAFVAPEPLVNHLGEGMGVMQECQKFLEENSSDDIRGRRIIQNLYGGLASCNKEQKALPSETLTESGLEKVDEAFDKLAYLEKLNIKNFKSIVTALMVSELSYMNQDGDFPKEKLLVNNKEAFKLQLKEKFPRIEEEGFSKAFSDVFESIQANKNKIPENTYESSIGAFEALADNNKDSVNKTCGAIHEEYQEKFGDSKRWYGLDWTRTKTQEELDFIAEKRNLLRTKIDQVYTSTNMGFLLGTDHFKEHVMDPTVDYAETCLDEKEHMVIKPNIQKSNFQAALVSAREQLFESLDDMSTGSVGPTQMLSISTADYAIEDYLKTDRKLILETILNAKGDKQKELAKFLCYRTMDIYDSDETLQYVGVLGGGVLSLAGAIGCALPFGVTQVVGCPAASIGAGWAVTASGIKAGQGYVESNRLDLSVAKGNTTSATSYADSKGRTSKQIKQAGVEAVLSALPLLNAGKVAGVSNSASNKGNGLVVASEPGKALTLVRQTGTEIANIPVPKAAVSVTEQVRLLNGTGQKLLEAPKVTEVLSLPGPSTALVPYKGVQTGLVPYRPNTSVIKVPGTSISPTTGREMAPLVSKTGEFLGKGREISTKVFTSPLRSGVTLEGEFTVVGIKKMLSLQNPKQILNSIIPVAYQGVKGEVDKKDSGISLKEREEFKRARNISTLPSEKLGNEFALVLQNTVEVKPESKVKAMVFLREILNLTKNATDVEIKTKLMQYQKRLDPMPHRIGSSAYQVSEDEMKRLDVLVKIALSK